MHEIITIQLGQASNHVATHFWNTQESYFTYDADKESQINHDVHFRTGFGAGGIETFTPRTLIYDLKGGFGSLRKINALYDVDQGGNSGSGDGGNRKGAWTSLPVTITEAPIPTHTYQQSLDTGNLEDTTSLSTSTVKYWSDFNRVFYHPRSIIQLSDFELNSSLMPFDRWDEGDTLFASIDKEHDVLDRDLRFFAEECDRMQAIQIMTSIDDAWGGFGAQYLERLEDEYGKTARLVWGIAAGRGGDNRRLLNERLNSAKSLQSFGSTGSLYVPLAMPPSALPADMHLEPTSPWHTSAIVATAVESMMLFSRLKGNSDRDVFIDDAIATLNTNGHQNVAGLRLDMQQKESEEGIAQSASSDAPHTQAMMLDARLPQINGSIPYGGTQPPPTLAIDFLPPTSLPRQRPTHLPRQSYAAILTMSRGCSPASRSPVPILDYSSAPTVRIQNLYTPLRFPLITSFPSSITGSQSALAEGKSLALSALLSTGGGVGAYISGLREVARGLMDVEVREVMVEELGRLKEGYVEGWGDDEEEEEDYDD